MDKLSTVLNSPQMIHFSWRIYLILSLCLIMGGFVFIQNTDAAITSQISYQGKLTNSSGTTVSDTGYSFKFSIYDASTGGNRLWTAKGTVGVPTALTATTTSGLFSVMLGDTSAGGGSQNAISLDFNTAGYYLGVTVGSDDEMTPRKALGAAPYAFNTDYLDGKTESAFATLAENETISGQWTFSATTTLATTTVSNQLGVATTTPATGVELAIGGDGYLTGGLGVGIATTTAGVLQTTGMAYINGNLYTGGNASVVGNLALSGTGTSTIAGGLTVDTNTLVVDFSGNKVGIGINPSYPLDISNSSAYRGVNVLVSTANGTAIYASASDTSGTTYGVYSKSSGTLNSTAGVYGLADSATPNATVGGYFASYSDTGAGVEGLHASSSGIGYGAIGTTLSSSGWGGFFSGGYGIYGSRVFAASSTPSSVYSAFESVIHGQEFISSQLAIATSTPPSGVELAISGDGYLTGGLGVGLVNTTAGTLQTSGNATIGGDLTLSGTGTTTVTGNLDVKNNVQIGDATTDMIWLTGRFGSNLLPIANNTYDLGAYANAWQNVYASTSLYVGTASGAFLNFNTLGFGGAASINTGGTLSINTSDNQAITTGTGLVTTGGNLYVTGTTSINSTTGTSTIAGGLTVDTSTLVVDFSGNKVGIGTNPAYTFDVTSAGTRSVNVVTSNTSGYAVYGDATGLTTGSTYGGYFQTAADAGYGVYGSHASTGASATGYGVYGTTSSSIGWGGYFTGSGYGVYGNRIFAASSSPSSAYSAFESVVHGEQFISSQLAIATSSPASGFELAVAGDGYLTGNMTLGGDLTLSGTGTTTVTGNFDVLGSTKLGSDSTDMIETRGYFISSLLPKTNNLYDLGAYGNAWRSVYASTSVIAGGTATLNTDSLIFTGAATIDSNGTLSLNTTNNQVITTGTGLVTTGGNLYVTGTTSINSTTGTSTIAGGLTVDTNTLVVDFSGNKVGIGTNPVYTFDVTSAGTRSVNAVNTNTSGYAVYGDATGLTTGSTYGGYFQTVADAGYGVYGSHASTGASATGYGVYGTTSSSVGWGGYFTGSGYGLYGNRIFAASSTPASAYSAFESVIHGQEFISSQLAIATSTPPSNVELAISGDGYLSGGLGVGVVNTTAGTIQTTSNIAIPQNKNVILDSGAGDNSTIGYRSTGTAGVDFYTDANLGLTITNVANVGVATTTPTAKLHILQTAAADAFRVDDALGDTTPFVIDQSGNVGIGTTTPATGVELAVVGDAYLTGGLGVGLVNTTAGTLVTSGTGTSTIAGGLTVDTTTLVVDSGGNKVGIGTNPAYTLDISTSGSRGINVTTSNTSGYAVYGDATGLTTGSTYGGYFQTAADAGYGVYGVHATSGAGYGVYGTTTSATGWGGFFTGSGYGLYGSRVSAATTSPVSGYELAVQGEGIISSQLVIATTTLPGAGVYGLSVHGGIFNSDGMKIGGSSQTQGGLLELYNEDNLADVIEAYSNTNSILFMVKSGGNVGVATDTPATTFSVSGNGYLTGGLGVGAVNTTAGTIKGRPTFTDTSGTLKGVDVSVRVAPSGESTAFYQNFFEVYSDNTNQITGTGGVEGLRGEAYVNAQATTTNIIGVAGRAYISNTIAATTTSLYSIYAVSPDAEDAPVTTAAGVYIEAPSKDTGSITNAFGLYVADTSSIGSTNSYSIYSAGPMAVASTTSFLFTQPNQQFILSQISTTGTEYASGTSTAPFAIVDQRDGSTADEYMEGSMVLSFNGDFGIVSVGSTATSGATYPGYFITNADTGAGVYGQSATSGATASASGVYGISSAGAGFGVYGLHSGSGLGYGVYGQTNSTAGYAVYGYAPIASTGASYGGFFQSAADLGRGVYGYHSTTSGLGYGVYGKTDSSTGWAGYFTGGLGLQGDRVFAASSTPSSAYSTFEFLTHGEAFISSKLSIATSSAATQLVVQGGVCITAGSGCDSSQPSGSLMVDTAGQLADNVGDVFDIAERYPSKEVLEAGEVVVIDIENPSYIEKSFQPYQSNIVGIVSHKPAIAMEGSHLMLAPKGELNSINPYIALAGRVLTKVSLENGPIQIGDPLTSASLPGYAMKAIKAGPIVGKALQPFTGAEGETGKIIAFVNVSWWEPIDEGIPASAGMTESEVSDTSASVNSSGDLVAENLTVTGATKLANLTMYGDIDLNNNSMLNIRRLLGWQDLWSIDEFGNFVTQGTIASRIKLADGREKIMYTLQSPEVELTISGSAQLENGEKAIIFDKLSCKEGEISPCAEVSFSEIISDQAPLKVIITPTAETSGIYVVEKNAQGFKVKELNSGTSNATFDWLVIARRKGYEEITTENPTVEPVVVEAPVTESQPVEPAVVEAIPAESQPVEPAPVEQPAETTPEAPAAESQPVEPVAVEPAPAESQPTEPVEAPVTESQPTEVAPAEPAPAEPAPAEQQPAEPAPIE